MHSDQCKALIHAFFAERAVAKIPDIPKDTPVYPIRQAGVIGAGTMGGGIAMALANAGIPVRIKDSGAGGARPRHGDHPQRITNDRSKAGGSRRRGGRADGEDHAAARTGRASIRPTSSSKRCSNHWR